MLLLIFVCIYFILIFKYFKSLKIKKIAVLSSDEELIKTVSSSIKNNKNYEYIDVPYKVTHSGTVYYEDCDITNNDIDAILIVTKVDHEKLARLDQKYDEYEILYSLVQVHKLYRPKVCIFIVNDKEKDSKYTFDDTLHYRYSYYLCLYRIQLQKLKDVNIFNNLQDAIDYLIK